MQIVSQVMNLYAEIDQSVAEFQLKSGLRCPAGCGVCCPNADVQVSILEMLPMAHEILTRGEAAEWLARIEAQPESGHCVLYKSDPLADAAGHCACYQWRPALCRLFGFASVRSRTGAKMLSVCRHIRQSNPIAAAAASDLAEQAPAFIHFSTRIHGLDPALANPMIPINEALRHAIERIGLFIAYGYGETLKDNTAA